MNPGVILSYFSRTLSSMHHTPVRGNLTLPALGDQLAAEACLPSSPLLALRVRLLVCSRFLAGAESLCERVPGPGSAERRSRSDAAGALDAAARSGTIESEKDGFAQYLAALANELARSVALLWLGRRGRAGRGLAKARARRGERRTRRRAAAPLDPNNGQFRQRSAKTAGRPQQTRSAAGPLAGVRAVAVVRHVRSAWTCAASSCGSGKDGMLPRARS
jgi:hypothetical protein